MKKWTVDASGGLTKLTGIPHADYKARAVFPISYGVVDSFIPYSGGSPPQRVHPVVCTLRPTPAYLIGTDAWWKAAGDSRGQVLNWAKAAVQALPQLNGSTVSI